MKKSKNSLALFTLLALISSQALAACNHSNDSAGSSMSDSASDSASASDSSSSSSTPSSPSVTQTPTESATPEPVPTYTVTFKDGDQIVYTASGTTGDFVDIPEDLLSTDPRYTFLGWEGLDENDYAAKKVEIFSEDLTFNAKWYERFGTETTFTATKVGSAFDDIVVDGVMDAAYVDATEIPVNVVTSGNTDTTATVKVMWDSTYLYLFADVKDSTVIGRDDTYQGGQWTEHNDTFEIWFDLLHDDRLAAADWNGGWGGPYRGEPGPMCEAHFKINAGYQPTNGQRFGSGSEACWDGWLSNECNNDGVSVGYSKITEDGYTVEYKIKTNHGNVPEELRLHENQEIGLGIKIYDKTTVDEEGASKENAAENAIALEAINGNMSGPKKLSNFRLAVNGNDNRTTLEVKEVRDCFDVVVDGSEDLLYKDANTTTLGNTDSTVKMLFNEDNVYVYTSLDENTEYVKISSSALTEEINVTPELHEFAISPANSLLVGSKVDLRIVSKEKDGEEISTDYVLKMVENDNNLSSPRKLFEAKRLADDAAITVDGVKDAAYDGTQEITIDTIALLENNTTADQLTTTGKAWIRWDDTYLYVFVDVIDSFVNTAVVGEAYNNDSVEFWLSTCQTLPTSSTGWGDANRPSSDWCGEGGWRVWAGNIGGLSGMHWMYDWADGCPREVASVLTENGYTVEYKLHLSAFAGVENKTDQIIDFMININDGTNNVRNGIVSTNTGGANAFDKPYNLDHLKLVA